MSYKKFFFPIGGGEELEERIYGALLISRYFNVNLEILKCKLTSAQEYKEFGLPRHILQEIENVVGIRLNEEEAELENIISQFSLELGLEYSNNLEKKCQINLNRKDGIRSNLIEQESKFCDLVIAAAPPQGVTTATFETAVLKSGKPVLMFPRVMKKFELDSVIIGWNNSPEASRAITSAIDLLRKAQKVHIVSSMEYVSEMDEMNKLLDYLKEHDINASYEIVETTRIPGQALLNNALDGNFDLIVAGAYGHKGLKELMFGGATRYLLENSTIPVFMSH